jgi:methionyl-tRNA synthetase
VPGDKDQVMYVWCDALTNYISAMGYAKNSKTFRTFWPCDLHVIGKDILRFHAGVWLGMLLSANLPLPKAELVHGWIHYQGDRMSKSKGNVVDPIELAKHYGVDETRYYLLSEIPVGQDGDFSYGLFENKVNADLAHNLGNFVNRVMSMMERYRGGTVPTIKTEVPDELDDLWEEYHLAMSEYHHQKASLAMISLVNFGNKLIADLRPWDLAKLPGRERDLDIARGARAAPACHKQQRQGGQG